MLGRGQTIRIWRTIGWSIVLVLTSLQLSPASSWAAVAEKERDPVILSVVAVNPSESKTQVVPVKIELPQEVTPKDVLEKGELKLEYDDDRKLYYVYKEDVALEPKETRVFEVTLRDLWFVPEKDIDALRDYTKLLMDKLGKSEYAQMAKNLAENITERLEKIRAEENDETLTRQTRIGNYRYHLLTIAQIKEDLARMEKLLTFTGGPPVPEMLEESPLKSDAPSTTTTWLVIFLILIFVGLLGAQFFFTWHRRMQVTQDLNMVRQVAFPSSPPVGSTTKADGNGGVPASRRPGA